MASRAVAPPDRPRDPLTHGVRGAPAAWRLAAAPESDRRAAAGLSGVVITYNEADRILDCLASLDFCDEVVVLDSGSTDGTRELAAAAGARVFEHPFESYGAQRNRAADLAEHDWVLCLDADERVSPGLRAELIALRDAGFGDHVAWSAPRLSRHLGAWIRYGTWYPNRELRLYDRRRARWGGGAPHEHVAVDEGVGRLAGDIEHHPYRSLDEHMRKIDSHATAMAALLHERGRRARASDLVLRPALRFLSFYVLKRGCLHGWRGLLLAYLAAHFVRLKYAKLLVLQHGVL